MPVTYYEQLVFPQVEELSRESLVVLPLGGPPQEIEQAVLHQFSSEEDLLVMPPLPYGLHPGLRLNLQPVIDSLLQVWREDGFHRFQLLELSCPDPPRKKGAVVVPLGHTEQHGFHLPLSSDTTIVAGLCREVIARLEPAELAGALPAWPYGVSTHRRQFPGTLSLDPRVFEDLMVELAGQLLSLTGGPIYLLNGHGGNHSFLVNVCKFAGERFPQGLTATSFLHTSSGAALVDLLRTRDSLLMGHACELETSLMLHLLPDQVQMRWALPEVDFLSSSNYTMDWVESGALVMNPPWSDDTRSGTYGDPRTASAEKGQRWLGLAANEIVQQIREVCWQQRKRQDRRQQGWIEGAWRSAWKVRPT